ncbi:MAG: hypothetical protein CL923_05560 [Deltaproteobacteria bacterium]|jgi:hypothetical protein|nr:hypothetical protein [Deltaproteobacteria bacterium]MDP7158540.1 DUF4258 domain-containing protein [SAR324 cluster bacterium]MDP7463321.1 DUF4258 domain-containing protein [SAR324 cluster bacterium]
MDALPPQWRDTVRKCAKQGAIEWRTHALHRMLQRGITRGEVVETLLDGELIEAYPQDSPFPRGLLFHMNQQPLHVAASCDLETMTVHIHTAYRPDSEYFLPDFKTRRIS